VNHFDLTPTEAKCPGCGTHLERLAHSMALPAACPRCRGLWLDSAACQKVHDGTLSEYCIAFIQALTNEAAGRGAPTGYREPARPDRACPVCRRALTPTRVSELYVTLDVCEHGTFFDPDEVAALVTLGTERRAQTEREVAAFRRHAELTPLQRFLKLVSLIGSHRTHPK
jgi:Zn-finger nucleic acid-binding protein